MIFENKDKLKEKCAKIIKVEGQDVTILDEAKLRNKLIDDLIYTKVFSADKAAQDAACWIIRRD